MQRGFFIATLLAVAFCSGCDVLDSKQFVIPNASPGDKATIKRVVNTSAVNAGLSAAAPSARVPNVLAYYTQPNTPFSISLGARMVNTSAVIDLSCFHPGPGTSPLFKRLDSSLTETLRHQFGERLTMPDVSHKVPF